MWLAQRSVRRMKPRKEGVAHGEGESVFLPAEELTVCSAEEGLRRFFSRAPAQKPLFVLDGSSLDALTPHIKGRLTVVLDGRGALSLFHLPDGVSCVVASGGEETLLSARAFATLRRVPCALFPTDGRMGGVMNNSGRVTAYGEKLPLLLQRGEAYCDETLLKSSLAGAYGRLLLARLALFEARALNVLSREEVHVGSERAFGLLSALHGELTAVQIAELNGQLRQMEEAGLPVGEGVVLAERYRRRGAILPEWQAFSALLRLYTVFLNRGKPRRYAVPDYAGRSASAGVPYAAQRIPTPAQYAERALALERGRAVLLTELRAVERAAAQWRRTIASLSGEVPPQPELTPLKLLPEYGGGLSALARDFGLLEWN